jgi:hypothetical protein
MKKLYSLLACSGTGEQNNTNYFGSPVRYIAFVIGMFALMIGFLACCVFEWIGFIYFFVCIFASVVCNNKPSIFHTMPIDYKKRTLTYFATLLFRTLLVILALIATIAFAIAFSAIEEAINGATVADASEAEEAATVALSAAAIWFSAFRTLFFCGGISGIARIQNEKHYLIGMLAFILIYAIGGFFLGLAVAQDSEYSVMLWLYVNFENFPLPWLATALCGLFAVGACVCSALYVLRIEKPKAF